MTLPRFRSGSTPAAPPASGAAVLEAIDLVRHFPARAGAFGRARGTVKAVDGVSFAVRPGETFAIVGESGCGKSTVARLLLRLLEPTSGAVRFEGRDIVGCPPAELRRLRARLQIVFQDPYGSLNPRMTVRAMLEEPLALHRVVAAGERAARIAELLVQVGLASASSDRYPHEFSGGQRQRIAIARALAGEPRVIVCDEPVSALDVSIQAQILNLLGGLQQRLGLAYVFISHDLAVVRHIASTVGVMYLGRLVEIAPAAELFARPRHPYTRALLASIPLPLPGARGERTTLPGDVPSPLAPPPGCRFHTRCPHAIELCRREVPALALDGVSRVACHRAFELGGFATATAAPVANPGLARLQAAFLRRAPGAAGPLQ